jgi:GR25 family glycosyltransferase involved in LPS biosynthesis
MKCGLLLLFLYFKQLMSIQLKMIVYTKSLCRITNFFNQKKKLPQLEMFNGIDAVNDYDFYKSFALTNNIIRPELINFLEGTIINNKPLYGILGCYLSHIFVLNDFINSNYEWLLVLEDDVILENFNIELINELIQEANEIDSNFIQLYTSPQFFEKQLKEKLITKNLRKMISQWGAVAYLINRKAVTHIINLIPCHNALDIVYSENIDKLNSTCFLNNNIINMGSYDCKGADNELGSIIMNNP